MLTLYVNKKSELTRMASNYKFEQVYRTRLTCNCNTIPGGNRRNGILVISGSTVVLVGIKCKACVKNNSHG